MKIAIDASRAINESAGIGKYTKYFIESLLKLDTNNEYRLYFNFWRNFKEKKQLAEKYRRSNAQIFCTKYPGAIKDKLLGGKVGFYGNKIKDTDIFIAPTFLDIDQSLKIPQILVIYDLSMFNYPEHLGLKLSKYFRRRTEHACHKARKIIAISQSTKNDLINVLKINKEKIEVIYPGQNQFSKISPALPKSFNLKPKNYLLFVGTIEPRKNLKNLLIAYGLLPIALREKYPLVIVGGKGWNNDEELRSMGSTKGVKWLGYVEDADLAKLYKEASVFVYPSLYEGFGFPIIEAMQYGTPVITSNISSMPEVAGSAGIIIDPDDPKSISSAIQSVLEGKISRAKLSKAGIERARKFTWEKAAQETLKLIENTVTKSENKKTTS